jgi:hypothetical protein
MKLFVIAAIYAATALSYAAELVTATVGATVRSNDTLFPTTQAFYKADATVPSGVTDQGFFKLNVASSYVKKTTSSVGSNVFRIKVELLGAADALVSLSNGKTHVLSSDFPITVDTFQPSPTKSHNLTITPASPLLAGTTYKLRVSIERNDLVNSTNVWLSDVASMKKDVPLVVSAGVTPALKLHSLSGNTLKMRFLTTTLIQRSAQWKIEGSTTLATGSFAVVNEAVILPLSTDPATFEVTLTINKATHPKRFFRLQTP